MYIHIHTYTHIPMHSDTYTNTHIYLISSCLVFDIRLLLLFSGYVPRRRHSINTMDLQTALEENVANRARRPSLSGEDDEADLDFLAELKEQALAPIKEDLADWLAKTLGSLFSHWNVSLV